MTNDTLVPTAQKTIIFYDDEITAVIVNDGQDQEIYVPVRPLCEYLGVSWNGQRERIKRDLVLNEVTMSARVTRADIAEGRPTTKDQRNALSTALLP